MTSIADLEIFARVVTAGSMSAAGRELDLSPAVVSKRIHHLETKLGARLFHRTTRQLQLTEQGRGFYDRVVGILATMQEAEAFISSGNESPSGELRVTAPTGFCRLHIAPRLGEFLHKYNDLDLELISSDHVLDIVREGIDVAIRIADLSDSSLVARKLAPVRQLFCAAPSYLKEFGEPKTLAELSGHKILIETNATWRVEGPEGVVSLKPQGNLRTNSSDIVHEAVLAGCGIALRSTWQVYRDLADKTLVQILPQYKEVPGRAIHAVYPTKEYTPAKLRIFLDFLSDIIGPEPFWDKGLNLKKPKSAKSAAPVSAA